MNRFPLNAFPQDLKEVILDLREETQAPEPLIASSVLSALSLALQDKLDIQVTTSIQSPVSLFFLVIANSGERKTSVDRRVLAPIYEHDRISAQNYEVLMAKYSAEHKIWKAKEKAILASIEKKAKKGLATELEDAQYLAHSKLCPKLPKNEKRIYNNVTPEALQLNMFLHQSNIGLIADEGANILDRKVMNDLSFLNSIWDGHSFQVERKTMQSFQIENGRITLSVMVQQAIFEEYLKKQGIKAKGSGFFARCLPVLIDEQLSTQGSRFIRDYSNNHHTYIELFHQKICSYLKASCQEHRECIAFDPQAELEWKGIYNDIEEQLRRGGDYENIRDTASKMANNIARLSALLSYFERGTAPIDKVSVGQAKDICLWYMEQANNLFGALEWNEEVKLLDWLDYFYRRENCNSIRKNDIRKYGPNSLRRGKRLDVVLQRLEREGCIDIEQCERQSLWVCQGPTFFNNSYTKKQWFRN
ncbi:YfjI family protein [Providencia rettgeri]|uniref:YfjI family protein n=1 Tax=Providencia hangzhouensis TaxID=3031799 RepID=A0ABY9ZCX7_9GAMM|nr:MULTISPECIES: YfjI family protein [Providencia]QLI96837.1 DUF3987 domain-containing protein [Providencia rettgeri]WNK25598.1 YfjI family protein [Providencia hangzhouensis]